MIAKSLKLIGISLMLCINLTAETTLLVHLTNGTIVQYPTSDLTDITFPVDGVRKMIVNNTSAADVTYTLSDISKLTISYPVTDYDGNTYQTATIGNQIWTAENLKVTKYRDGSDITYVTAYSTWRNMTSGAYSYYGNNPSNATTYGVWYNWFAATDNTNIAPEGWHVPTNAEWTELENYLTNNGFNGLEAAAIKSTSGWNNSGNGTDSFGFGALPNGVYYDWGSSSIGSTSYFWSAIESTSSTAWSRVLNANTSVFELPNQTEKRNGIAIRLLKD
jgi:uncharacterized protein (TIGR02145 family)